MPCACEPDFASADGGRSSTPDPVQQLLDEGMGPFERARALTDAATREAQLRVADLKAAAANASQARRKTMSAEQKLAEEGLREASRRGGEISAVVGNLRVGFGR